MVPGKTQWQKKRPTFRIAIEILVGKASPSLRDPGFLIYPIFFFISNCLHWTSSASGFKSLQSYFSFCYSVHRGLNLPTVEHPVFFLKATYTRLGRHGIQPRPHLDPLPMRLPGRVLFTSRSWGMYSCLLHCIIASSSLSFACRCEEIRPLDQVHQVHAA